MLDQCKEHQTLAVSIVRMESKLDNINEKLEVFQDHVKESVRIRDTIMDNKRFRTGATRALWILYGSITGIITKMLFFK